MEESLKEPAGYHWDSYCSDDVETYAEKIKLDIERTTFLRPVIQTFLKTEAPGKKVLDVGCGPGYWCREAAEYGAKSVDGLDIQEGIVKLAKHVTAQYSSSVNISIGDVMDMPYDDNTFDVAISIIVTCNLPIEALTKHFKELNRVLVPDGKALVHNLSDSAYQTLYLFNEDNEAAVRESIELALQNVRDVSSLAEINNAFEGCGRVVRACFAKDKNESLYLCSNANHLTNGQIVWFKTERMAFPNYFYDDKYLYDQIVAAGLRISKIDNPYTEDNRIAYNNVNPRKKLSNTITVHPPSLIYYLHKRI